MPGAPRPVVAGAGFVEAFGRQRVRSIAQRAPARSMVSRSSLSQSVPRRSVSIFRCADSQRDLLQQADHCCAPVQPGTSQDSRDAQQGLSARERFRQRGLQHFNTVFRCQRRKVQCMPGKLEVVTAAVVGIAALPGNRNDHRLPRPVMLETVRLGSAAIIRPGVHRHRSVPIAESHIVEAGHAARFGAITLVAVASSENSWIGPSAGRCGSRRQVWQHPSSIRSGRGQASWSSRQGAGSRMTSGSSGRGTASVARMTLSGTTPRADTPELVRQRYES